MKKPILNQKQYEITKYQNLITGIEKQRDIYKLAKIQGLQKQMADSIENIKSDIKSHSLKNNGQKNILKIEKILDWYNNLDNLYTKKTPKGNQIIYPPNITDKINKYLTIAYETCMTELDKLDLL